MMNTMITGINIDITPALRDYVEKKLERVLRHTDQLISHKVTLSVDKLEHKAEVDIHIAGKPIHVENVADDMYAAIDILMDKLDRTLIKAKEKQNNHRTIPTGRA